MPYINAVRDSGDVVAIFNPLTVETDGYLRLFQLVQMNLASNALFFLLPLHFEFQLDMFKKLF